MYVSWSATALHLLPWLVWHQFWCLYLACTTHCVTKDMPIPFTNSNKLKNCRTGLTNHTQPISHHWLLMPSGVDTHTNTYRHANKNNFKKSSTCGLLQSWFNSLPLLTALYSSNISSFISMLNSLSACIKWSHDASGCLSSHNWNIFVQQVLASLG